MLVQVQHGGAEHMLSLSTDGLQLVLSPTDSTLPTTILLAHIAFISFSLLALSVVHLAPPESEATDALPTVHTLVLDLPTNSGVPPSLDLPALTLLRLHSSTAPRSLHVILNPSAGARTAQRFFAAVVRPLLDAAAITYDVSETSGAGDAGVIGARAVGDGARTVLLVGGDGTTHEFVNGVLGARARAGASADPIDIILVPLGTANAYYYHLFPPEQNNPMDAPLGKLHSLLAFLRSSPGQSSGLMLARNDLSGSPFPVYTTVVTSFALHASLLSSAESLRATHPGLERFALAASLNADRWTRGTLFLPPSAQLYSPVAKSWTPVPKLERTLEDEFSYLTAALTDRFEPSFVIAPFRSSTSAHPPAEPSIDLVVIRPLRDPATLALERAGDGIQAREAFVARIWATMGGAYKSGRHVDEVGENGESVVEYYRVESFKWAPADSNEPKDRLACLDGALHPLGSGGSITTTAQGAGTTGLCVWGVPIQKLTPTS